MEVKQSTKVYGRYVPMIWLNRFRDNHKRWSKNQNGEVLSKGKNRIALKESRQDRTEHLGNDEAFPFVVGPFDPNGIEFDPIIFSTGSDGNIRGMKNMKVTPIHIVSTHAKTRSAKYLLNFNNYTPCF